MPEPTARPGRSVPWHHRLVVILLLLLPSMMLAGLFAPNFVRAQLEQVPENRAGLEARP